MVGIGQHGDAHNYQTSINEQLCSSPCARAMNDLVPDLSPSDAGSAEPKSLADLQKLCAGRSTGVGPSWGTIKQRPATRFVLPLSGQPCVTSPTVVAPT